jgi:phosphatidate cytidylyltransferase
MRAVGVVLGLLVSCTLVWCPRADALGAMLIITALTISILHLLRFGELTSATSRCGLMVFGVIYVAMFLTPLALLNKRGDGQCWIFLVMTITWFSDTGAYFVGRTLGKIKLYPAISPGKSVEGAIGGLVSSIGAALLAKLWYMPFLGWRDVLLLSLVGGTLSQLGDLVESMFKRSYGVKDSGWIIPGHGGLLDRIDALLFSTPYIFLYAHYLF